MRPLYLSLALIAAASASQAEGGHNRVDQIKARGHLSCAAFSRPGLVSETDKGFKGILPEICRAVAIATLGPDAGFEFEALELPKNADDLNKGEFDLLFLSEPEMAQASLGGKIAPGPAVFLETYALMTEEGASPTSPEDFAGATVCFHEAEPASQALQERLEKKGLSFIPMPFQEDVELLDAYNARHCKAVVSETTDLAELRLKKGVNKFDSRIINEPLAVFPIFAATPIDDPQWSAAVTWVATFLQAAEQPQSKWRAGGAKSLPLDVMTLGLDSGWRDNVLAKVGDYGAIYQRGLGDQSPFKLPRGVNASWQVGGLLAPPLAD